MYAVTLTSIPPRLPRLGPVLASLLAQKPAPARVVLCLPERWARFPGDGPLPALPDGVELLRVPEDFGPATKAIGPARALAGQVDRMIYCDDDWLMPPGWAAALLAEWREGAAVAASGWSVERLKRQGAAGPGCVDIAQGFSGVLIDPRWLSGAEVVPPAEARAVDDIWLSGQLARQGLPIRLADGARAGMAPAFEDGHALQDAVIGGRGRHGANMACVEVLTRRFGIWPAQ
ncbi:MAG: hypothetical protein RIA08_02505 [Roseovarius sp.]|uniref:hypothetical protein n=1 Tax=Roseovarius sp. TaxID=1486281 RepID=UPI0032EE6050